jgi:hypothetical protein
MKIIIVQNENLGQSHIDKKMRSFRNFVFFVSLALFFTTFSIFAEENVPTFTVKGFISSERSTPFNTNNSVKIDGTILFLYSNGVWQAQFTYQDLYYSQANRHISSNQMAQLVGTMIDCKRIPDGIRQIITPRKNTNSIIIKAPKGDPYAYAITKSIAFPEMADQVLFLPWLSLCPSPELPLISSNHIHFNFSSQFLNNPQNEGDFNASYIEPKKAFLFELDVTNNGTMFQLNGSFMKYPTPYANGFEQFSYKVLETTNCNGIIFPLNTVLYQFDPLPSGKSADDIYPTVITRLSIQQIDVGDNHLFLTLAPTNLVALDSRPSGLNNGVTVNYNVNNDQWPSITNKKVAQLANFYRSQPINKIKWEDEHSRNRTTVFIVFAIITLIPLGFVWKTKLNNNNNN